MATVHLAEDLKLHRQVALKLLHPDLNSALGPERFLREIAVASRLNHPHILPLHDSGEAEGRLFYAMPYVEGESLRQRLEREPQLPVDEAVRILQAVASALDYAHRAGVVHRDIKPENILLARGPGEGPAHPLVADFGLARALDVAGGERLTATGLALGTPGYMSPEQAAGGHGIDGRTDIYALGCVAYEMLAGAPPFTGPTAQAVMARHAVDPVPPLRTVRATVPPAVEAAISRALAKVPADRFATAAEFAEALAASEGAVLTRHRWRGAKWPRVVAGVAAVVALTLPVARMVSRTGDTVLAAAANIVVLPFSGVDGDTALTRLGQDLATTLGASLNGVGGITTTDRLSVAAALAGRSDLSAADAEALARRLGARSMVRGTVVGNGEIVRLDLGLFEVEGGGPLTRGITITGRRDSLGALTDSATWAIIRQVWQRGDVPSPSLEAVTTRSVPALRAFLEGERLLELNRWDEAELAYRGAVAADSTFWLAQFRYQQTLSWQNQEVDHDVMERLHLHRETFPEPDRLILDMWSSTHRNTPSLQLALAREATRRFPGYWPGWLALGDWLFHVGPMHGHGWAEAQGPLQRAVELNPRLLPAWLHLFGNSAGKDTVESERALSGALAGGLVRSDAPASEIQDALRQERVFRLLLAVAKAGGTVRAQANALADTVAMDWVEVPPTKRLFAAWGFLWWGFPAAQIDLNRRILRLGPGKPYRPNQLRGIAWGWAERGAWDSALAVMREAVTIEPDPVIQGGPHALDEFELAALGAWLGVVDPSAADNRRSAVLSMVPLLRDSSRKADLLGTVAWLDGLVAFSRADLKALERARGDARRSGHIQSSLIDRSLRAFGRALVGDRATAGRELAALEWECADVNDCSPYVPNIAIQRLAAANWLLEAGDTTEAARLLVWHESAQGGWNWAFSFATTPLAYLTLARIESVRGDSGAAKAHYDQFLRRYDSPMAAQRYLLDEARVGLARVSGRSDPPAR
jgi:serine/threonine-protein kinase